MDKTKTRVENLLLILKKEEQGFFDAYSRKFTEDKKIEILQNLINNLNKQKILKQI